MKVCVKTGSIFVTEPFFVFVLFVFMMNVRVTVEPCALEDGPDGIGPVLNIRLSVQVPVLDLLDSLMQQRQQQQQPAVARPVLQQQQQQQQ